jgi:hypothetical protein
MLTTRKFQHQSNSDFCYQNRMGILRPAINQEAWPLAQTAASSNRWAAQFGTGKPAAAAGNRVLLAWSWLLSHDDAAKPDECIRE